MNKPQTGTLKINGTVYSRHRLANASLSGAVIDYPKESTDNPEMAEGEHSGFILHDGKMIRVVKGEYTTSRKARLISKILLKKALPDVVQQPMASPNGWKPASAPFNGIFDAGERRYGNRR